MDPLAVSSNIKLMSQHTVTTLASVTEVKTDSNCRLTVISIDNHINAFV